MAVFAIVAYGSFLNVPSRVRVIPYEKGRDVVRGVARSFPARRRAAESSDHPLVNP